MKSKKYYEKYLGQKLVLRDHEEGNWIKEIKLPRDFRFFLSAILNF